MLASEWRSSRRKKGFTDTSAFSVPWSEHKVRFSENMQIVDLGDCFAVVYGTPVSASSAQYKYFTADRQKTLDKLGTHQEDLFYMAKWDNTSQARTCIKAAVAVRFFKNILSHMKHAVKLSEALDKDHIDENMNELPPASTTQDDSAERQPTGGKSASNSGKKRKNDIDQRIATIYCLVYLPTNTKVYTGRTLHPDRRLSQHASRNSQCRLVRNAFRKYGQKAFALEPLMRCHEDDADVNESYWIIQNKTMYPDGYNLRHGSMAGENTAESFAVVPACTGVVPFTGIADETLACSEGWEDVSSMLDEVEDHRSEANQVCKDFLRQVHPDMQGGQSKFYSAEEVTAMLNSIRESL